MALVTNVLNLKREAIIPDPEQPRKTFNESALWELARSMESCGLLQPIVVRPLKERVGEAKYVLIAGERRWRAAGLLRWEHIPAIVRKNILEQDAAKLQLIENIVRAALDPVEEARHLKKMLDEDGFTAPELARATGYTPYKIKWRIEMLNAREDVLALVSRGHVTAAMAWELARLSHQGQGRALRVMHSRTLNAQEFTALCQQIYLEENQGEMFPEARASEEHRRVARNFNEVFERLARSLGQLQEMETKSPGIVAEALLLESATAEARVDELMKGLQRVKKGLQARRMQEAATEATGPRIAQG